MGVEINGIAAIAYSSASLPLTIITTTRINAITVNAITTAANLFVESELPSSFAVESPNRCGASTATRCFAICGSSAFMKSRSR